MRIGLIAQDINSGIGTQSWEFARNMNVSKVLVTDITAMHRAAGKKVTRYPERFKDYDRMVVDGIPDNKALEWLTDDVDLIFVIETPLNYELFNIARQKSVKTVLNYNYEFLDYAHTPGLPIPDLLLAPSPWWIDRVRDRRLCRVEHLPVPVATDRIKGSVKESAETFVHIAGHKTHADRNGTGIIQRLPNVVVDIHTQQTGEEKENYWELYESGDVLLLPRYYGGLSLQAQEAAAAGMVVVVGMHDPYAKHFCSVKSRQIGVIQTKNPVMGFEVDQHSLVTTIETLKGNPGLVKEWSERSLQWAKENSWDALKPKYQQLLASV